MTDYNEIIRNNVIRILNEKKLSDPKYTQTWLAKQIGISVQQLNNNLKGRRGLARIFSKLAVALDVDIAELFADDATDDERQILAIYRDIIKLNPTRSTWIYDFLIFELHKAEKKSSMSLNDGNQSGR